MMLEFHGWWARNKEWLKVGKSPNKYCAYLKDDIAVYPTDQTLKDNWNKWCIDGKD